MVMWTMNTDVQHVHVHNTHLAGIHPTSIGSAKRQTQGFSPDGNYSHSSLRSDYLQACTCIVDLGLLSGLFAPRKLLISSAILLVNSAATSQQ